MTSQHTEMEDSDLDSDSDWETDSDEDTENAAENSQEAENIQESPSSRGSGVSTFLSPPPPRTLSRSSLNSSESGSLDQSFNSRSESSISESNASLDTVIFVPPKDDNVDKFEPASSVDKHEEEDYAFPPPPISIIEQPKPDAEGPQQSPVYEQQPPYEQEQIPPYEQSPEEQNTTDEQYPSNEQNPVHQPSTGDSMYPQYAQPFDHQMLSEYESPAPSTGVVPQLMPADNDFPFPPPPPPITDMYPTDRSSSLSESEPVKDRSSDFDADGYWGDTFDEGSSCDRLDVSGEGFSRQSSVIQLPNSRPVSSHSSSSEDNPPPSKVSSLSLSRDSGSKGLNESDDLFNPMSTFKSTGDIKLPQVDLDDYQQQFSPSKSPKSQLKFIPTPQTASEILSQTVPKTTYNGIDPTASLQGVCVKRDYQKDTPSPLQDRYSIPRSELIRASHKKPANMNYSPRNEPMGKTNHGHYPPSRDTKPSHYHHHGYIPTSTEMNAQRNRLSSGSSNSRPSSILMAPDSLNRSHRSSRSVTFADDTMNNSESDHPSVDNSISRSPSLLNFADISDAKKKFYRHLFAYNIAFFLLFSAFIGLAVVQSSLNGRVGAMSLAVLFFVSIFACIFISPIANTLIGCKPTIVICFGGFFAWEASNFYPHYGTMIPTAVLCGVAYGSVWAAQVMFKML